MVSAVRAWIQDTVDRAKRNTNAEYLEKGFVIFSLFLYCDAVFDIAFGDASAIITRPLFLASYTIATGLLLVRYRDRLMTLLPKGGLVWGLLLLPVVSILWSDYPAVTFPAGLAVMQAGLFGTYLGLRFSLKELLHLLAYTFLGLLGLSLLFTIGVPGLSTNLDSEGMVRGVFEDANAFGLRMALGAIVFLILALDKSTQRRRASAILCVVSVACVLLSRSASAREYLVVVLAAIPAIAMTHRQKQKKSFVPAFMYFMSLMFGGILWALAKNTGSVVEAFHLDSLLTGSIDVEPSIIAAIKQHFWVGYGYAGFWVDGVDSSSDNLSELANVATDPHLHSGLLEALLNLGFLGVVCACVCLWTATLHAFIALRKNHSPYFFFPVLVFSLFLFSNFSEHSFYAYRNIFWMLFVSMQVLAIASNQSQGSLQELSYVSRQLPDRQFSNPAGAIGMAGENISAPRAPNPAGDELVDTLDNDAADESAPLENDIDGLSPQLSGANDTADLESPAAASLSDSSPGDRETAILETSNSNDRLATLIDESNIIDEPLAPHAGPEFSSETEEQPFTSAPTDDPPSLRSEADDIATARQPDGVGNASIPSQGDRELDLESQPTSTPLELADDSSTSVADSPQLGDTLFDSNLLDTEDELYSPPTKRVPPDSTDDTNPALIEPSAVDKRPQENDRSQAEPAVDSLTTESTDESLGGDPEQESEQGSNQEIDPEKGTEPPPDNASISEGETEPDLELWTDLATALEGSSIASSAPDPELEPLAYLEVDTEPDPSSELMEASDTEPDVEPDLAVWTEFVSELDRGSDESFDTDREVSSDTDSTGQSDGVKAAASVRELLFATHWLNTLDPDWIEESDADATSESDSPVEDSPQPSDRPTSPKPSVPTVLMNESMLRVHDLKFEVDSNAPIFKRLEAAELMNAAQLASVQTLWQQQGGRIATILQQETGLGITTLNFFSDTLWSRHLSQRKRIGEYLQEAELVTARDVQFTLDTLQQQQKTVPLGVALAERGLIRQTTADYFARSLVQRARTKQAPDPSVTQPLPLPSNVELAETPGGYPVCVVTLWGRLERRPHHQLRHSLFHAAEQFSPNVLVDMRLVTSVNASALGAIVAAANRCRVLRGQLCLCSLTPEVQSYLRNQSKQLGLKSFPNRRIAIEYFPIM